jgi:hypothetical protein
MTPDERAAAIQHTAQAIQDSLDRVNLHIAEMDRLLAEWWERYPHLREAINDE